MNQPPSQQGTVLLFGEVLADVFPDQTVLGGAPFNVACHLKAFGQDPILITRLGQDALGEKVLRAMSHKALDTRGVQLDSHQPTGQVKVHIETGGHRFEILPLQAYDFIEPSGVQATLDSARPALVYFGTLAQRHAQSQQALTPLLEQTGAARFLDINLRAPWYDTPTLSRSLQHADMVKLNEAELTELADTFAVPDGNPHDRARALMHQFDLEQLLVTCGDAGAWHMGRNGQLVETAPNGPAIQVVDTVGAGDGFASVFMLGNLRGWPIDQTLQRANTFAAAICEIRGAVPEHADFYTPYVKEWAR